MTIFIEFSPDGEKGTTMPIPAIKLHSRSCPNKAVQQANTTPQPAHSRHKRTNQLKQHTINCCGQPESRIISCISKVQCTFTIYLHVGLTCHCNVTRSARSPERSLRAHSGLYVPHYHLTSTDDT